MPDARSALGRSPPRDADPPMPTGAEHPRSGPAARAEMRWRDVQWVDFTGEPDGATIASPIPIPPAAASGLSGVSGREPPEVERVRYRVVVPAATRGVRSDAIPGLPSRFIRLPVAKLEARRTASRAVPPRAPPSASAIASGLPPKADSAAPRPPIIVTRAEAAPDAIPRPSAVTTRPRAARVARRNGRVSLFVASRENRWRVSGIAVLTVLVVALAAYLGGALLTAVTQTGRSALPTSAQSAVAKQFALADRVGHASQATTPTQPQAHSPPAAPIARAAFYLARAKGGDPVAQYNVGVLYARGQGLVQDYASAVTWFRAAAERGNAAAQYNLGVLYAQGLGVAADLVEALNWYRSAAEQNYPAAQFNLALAYATGDGTKQDYATATRWYQRAAAQALVPAMFNLAILYEAGTGVERSPVDAYAWYSAAGERGDAAAKTRAAELFEQLNERDKARAQGLAATIGAALDSFAPKLPPA